MAGSTVAALPASDALTGPELFYADGFAASVAADVKVTATQIRTWSIASLAAVATSGSASDLSAGTLPAARMSGSYTGITGVGTLTAGATGAGFTVALAISTITGALPAANFPTLTGDITTAGGSLATTLKNTGPGATGPLGSATVAPIVTIDAQGRVTALSSATITPAASSITGGAALTKTDDTNVTLTLGGTPTTSLLTATSLTLGWTGQLGLTRGGTAASLTASNGGIVYSDASALAILSGTATAGKIVRSGASAAPTWSTATYPATAGTAANVLRSDGTNFLSAALAAADLSNGTTGTGAVVLASAPTFTSPNFLTSATFNTTTILTFPAAASFQLGAADAAAPVAQTLRSQGVVTGTSNTAGAILAIAVSPGTGTGTGGSLDIQIAPAGTTGTSQNSFVTAWRVTGAGNLITPTNSTYNIGANGATSPLNIYASGTIQASAALTLPTVWTINTANMRTASNIYWGWSSDTSNSAVSDTIIIRGGAPATLQLGNADVDTNAAIVAQTLRTQGALAGGTADQAGKNFTIAVSPGKGTGAGGSFIVQTAPAGSTGTAVNALVTALTIARTGTVLASVATGGIGYGTGAGGAVTQATSKSTGVTLNTATGQITMNNASLAGQTEVSFTLTDSVIAATDTVIVNIASGATANSYIISVTAVVSGSCVIQLANVTLTTSLSEALVLNFAVIKGVTS